MAAKTVTLVKPYNSSTSIYFDGVTSTALDGVAGNITNGYTFTANGANAVSGDLIRVGDAYIDHAWKLTGSTIQDETIVGGNGADTIDGGNDSKADSLVGGSGKDVFVMDDTGTDVIGDFTYGEDVIYAGDTANLNGATFGAEGTITIDSKIVKLQTTDGIYKATVANKTNSGNIWFSNGTSVYMDASSETNALILDGQVGSGADTLYGGSGKDTIWAGANDLVYGGAGADKINIAAASTANVGVVLTSAGGTDSVTNFTFGTGASADYVDLFENSISDATISYAKGNVTASLGSASLVIKAGNADYQDVFVRDASGANYVVAVANAAQGSAIHLTGSENYVIGAAGYNTTAQVTVSGDATVDLSSKYDTDTIYQNIKTVQGGDGDDTIIGAAATNNSLAGGDGADSIWGGGASNDTLTGGDGADTFWFGSGDGADVITDYKVSDSDKIRLTDSSVASATRANTTTADVTIKMNDGSTLTVKGTTNASDVLTMDMGDGVKVGAEVGKTGAKNSFTSTGANYFYGSTSTDTLKVTDATTVKNNDVAAVYLDNRLAGTGYYSIENVDASGSAVDVELAGDSASNVITAGTGNASLWGGAGATADTLVGGSGTNTFYFGTGEGNDTITKSTASDQVMLYDVASTDVKSGVLSSTGVMTITLNDGSTLAIKGYNANSVATFTLTDGTYTYDYTGKEWNFKANS